VGVNSDSIQLDPEKVFKNTEQRIQDHLDWLIANPEERALPYFAFLVEQFSLHIRHVEYPSFMLMKYEFIIEELLLKYRVDNPKLAYRQARK
jgi:hypothetical protein